MFGRRFRVYTHSPLTPKEVEGADVGLAGDAFAFSFAAPGRATEMQFFETTEYNGPPTAAAAAEIVGGRRRMETCA